MTNDKILRMSNNALSQLAGNQNTKVLSSEIVATLTIQDALKSPSLARMVREESKDVCTAKIAKILAEFTRYLRTDLDTSDLVEYAKLTIVNYPTLKFDELIYTLKQVITGTYGKVYPNWRWNDLREWLDKSYKEVIQISEEAHLKLKDQSNIESMYGRSSEKNEKPISIDEALIQMEINKVKK